MKNRFKLLINGLTASAKDFEDVKDQLDFIVEQGEIEKGIEENGKFTFEVIDNKKI